jgi:glutaredoxin
MVARKRTVEVFTAGCPVCEPAVKMVQELACPSCEVKIHDLNRGCETDDCRVEAQKYGIKTVPAVVVDGTICGCCDNQGVNREDLKAAGIGTPL